MWVDCSNMIHSHIIKVICSFLENILRFDWWMSPGAPNVWAHSQDAHFPWPFAFRQPIGLRHPTVDSSQSHRFAHQYTKIVLFNQNHLVSFCLFTLIQANACDASELHLHHPTIIMARISRPGHRPWVVTIKRTHWRAFPACNTVTCARPWWRVPMWSSIFVCERVWPTDVVW